MQDVYINDDSMDIDIFQKYPYNDVKKYGTSK